LFDMGRYTANLERAYHEIQTIRLAGEAPRFIAIEPNDAPVKPKRKARAPRAAKQRASA
jgi:hypothetical protein